MNAKSKIKAACAAAGVPMSELAARLDMSPQSLNQRAKVGRFTLEEWEQIAKALGAEWVGQFVFEGGVII